jgi:membrane associated rhomboid family serine protease
LQIVIGQLEFVDGHAHLGGMIQGSLLAIFLLSDEQESINWKVRIPPISCYMALYDVV